MAKDSRHDRAWLGETWLVRARRGLASQAIWDIARKIFYAGVVIFGIYLMRQAPEAKHPCVPANNLNVSCTGE